jgi:hypothetical protein
VSSIWYSYSGRLSPRQVFESQTGVGTGFRVTRDWIHDLIYSRGFALTICWICASYRTVHASIITVTVICDFGHSSSSFNLDVANNIVRSTVAECTCNNKETIMTTSKQVTVICDFGHSSSSSNHDVKK